MKNKKTNSYTNSSTVFIQLLALAVIVMIFVMFIAQQGSRRASVAPSPAPLTDVQGTNFSKQGASDEITEIEADLKATDFSKLDTGLSDIDADLSE